MSILRAHMYYVLHVHAGCPWRSEGTGYPEAGVTNGGSLPWALGIKSRSSARTRSALRHWAIFPAPCLEKKANNPGNTANTCMSRLCMDGYEFIRGSMANLSVATLSEENASSISNHQLPLTPQLGVRRCGVRQQQTRAAFSWPIQQTLVNLFSSLPSLGSQEPK